MIMIQNIKILFVVIFLFGLSFTQNVIEGRWHLIGYEESIMYQFENNLSLIHISEPTRPY